MASAMLALVESAVERGDVEAVTRALRSGVSANVESSGDRRRAVRSFLGTAARVCCMLMLDVAQAQAQYCI